MPYSDQTEYSRGIAHSDFSGSGTQTIWAAGTTVRIRSFLLTNLSGGNLAFIFSDASGSVSTGGVISVKANTTVFIDQSVLYTNGFQFLMVAAPTADASYTVFYYDD